MRSSTLVIPGADHATRSASSRSIQERTVPSSITSLPFTWTLILLASPSAFRLQASMLLPLHGAFERYPAVLHDDLDLVVGNRQFRLQGGNRVARNIRIGTLIDGRQPHLEVVRNRKNPGDALRGGLGFK